MTEQAEDPPPVASTCPNCGHHAEIVRDGEGIPKGKPYRVCLCGFREPYTEGDER